MTASKLQQDTLQKFLFEQHHVRGMLVHLSATCQAAFQHSTYSPNIKGELSKALCATAILTASIKFKGRLTLQLQGKGPLSLLLVQSDESLHLRGLAIYKGNDCQNLKEALGDDAHLLIDIDQDRNTKRYQTTIQVNHEQLPQVLEDYFKQSEQLATRLWLFSDGEQAAGLMLQKLPSKAGDDEEDFWTHIETIAATITDKELLGLDNVNILRRLFHEEDVRLFKAEPVCFRCRCSLAKMQTAIESLGQAESENILTEQENIKITCDFCNKCYIFDAVDVAAIFNRAQGDANKTQQ